MALTQAWVTCHRYTGLAFVYISLRFHTPAGFMPFLTEPHGALLPLTTKITYDAAISPFCLLSQVVRGFTSHPNWVVIFMPSISALNSSCIFCRCSVPFLMYCTTGTTWIFSLSEDLFSATSTTPMSTLLTALMMMSQYRTCWSTTLVMIWCGSDASGAALWHSWGSTKDLRMSQFSRDVSSIIDNIRFYMYGEAISLHMYRHSTSPPFLLRTTHTTRTLSVSLTKSTQLIQFGLAAGLRPQPPRASNLQNFAHQNTSQTR